MTKYILAVPAVMLLSACTNNLNYDFMGVEPQLVVTGIMDAGQEEHVVYVSISEKGKMVPVKDAALKCYVNDVLVCEKSQKKEDASKKNLIDSFYDRPYNMDYSDDNSDNILLLEFSAKLVPGDEVRFEFEADGAEFKASSPVLSVPEQVAFSKLDTATVVTMDWEGFEHEYKRIAADLPDIKNENSWYCIEILKGARGVYTFIDDRPEVVVERKRAVYMADPEDLVLLDGNAPNNDILSMNALGRGDLAVFSDVLFTDDVAHLKIDTYSDDWNWYDGFRQWDFDILLSPELNTILYEQRMFQKLTADYTMNLYLSNCSEATYRYLRALRAVTSNGYIPQIMEPVTIPSNITGGLGFVDIVYSSVTEFNHDVHTVYRPW